MARFHVGVGFGLLFVTALLAQMSLKSTGKPAGLGALAGGIRGGVREAGIGTLLGGAGGTIPSATSEHRKIPAETWLQFQLLSDWKVH